MPMILEFFSASEIINIFFERFMNRKFCHVTHRAHYFYGFVFRGRQLVIQPMTHSVVFLSRVFTALARLKFNFIKVRCRFSRCSKFGATRSVPLLSSLMTIIAFTQFMSSSKNKIGDFQCRPKDSYSIILGKFYVLQFISCQTGISSWKRQKTGHGRKHSNVETRKIFG